MSGRNEEAITADATQARTTTVLAVDAAALLKQLEEREQALTSARER